MQLANMTYHDADQIQEYKNDMSDLTSEQATKHVIELEQKYQILVDDFVRTECRLSEETDEKIREVLETELQIIEKEQRVLEKEIEFIKNHYPLNYEE